MILCLLQDVEFFESRIRPALVEHCFECHAADKQKGGLRLDSSAAVLRGGDSGPAVAPGHPAESLLLTALRGGDPDRIAPMPHKKPRLPDRTIDDFDRWIRMGAPWGKDAGTGPAAADFAGELRRRAERLPSLRPLAASGRGSIDAILEPGPPADSLVWLRRVTFDLTGLPPSAEQIAAFEADPSRERVVDRLLASPRFGETWARHWLDLVRYAESRGHEFDYPIPNAWHYRDYVIRALNADLPYDRLVTEHLAGDLVAEPRLHPGEGFNESILATGWWYLGEQVHSPVDIRGDETDRIANQIDVFSKTFLGLTVACARCHDHKFDPISQADYTALAGFIKSSNYRQVRFDTMEHDRRIAEGLPAPDLPPRPRASDPALPEGALVVADYDAAPLLQDGFAFRRVEAGGAAYGGGPVVHRFGRGAAVFDPAWKGLALAGGTERESAEIKWVQSGRTLRTPAFTLERPRLYYLVRGAGHAFVEIDGHRMVRGPLHGKSRREWKEDDLRWQAHDLGDYVGHRMHAEITPAGPELAVFMVVQSDAAPPKPDNDLIAVVEAAAPDRGAGIRTVSRTAPAIQAGSPVDELFLVRGNPRNPRGEVPRRFLEAFGGGADDRLELARRVLETPLAPRVAVNRIWHHLFGRGIVPTVDDFGFMGQPASHPELLDFLARGFVDEGWSIKRTIRRIVLSRAYAANRPSRRLSAEPVRDAMLAVSGRLDETAFGPPVPIALDEFQQGRGRPSSGPLDGAGRRSIYLSVRRNFLSSFLLAFDFPQPFSTMGRRNVSNVPAQALVLRNNPFVRQQAELWARGLSGEGADRVERMFLAAFCRRPTAGEREAAARYAAEAGWTELGHALFQSREFVYVN